MQMAHRFLRSNSFNNTIPSGVLYLSAGFFHGACS
jgi:hypothetical protein